MSVCVCVCVFVCVHLKSSTKCKCRGGYRNITGQSERWKAYTYCVAQGALFTTKGLPCYGLKNNIQLLYTSASELSLFLSSSLPLFLTSSLLLSFSFFPSLFCLTRMCQPRAIINTHASIYLNRWLFLFTFMSYKLQIVTVYFPIFCSTPWFANWFGLRIINVTTKM